MVVAADCSHCHLPSGLALPVTDGPCKPYSKNSTECVNQAETNYCTTNPSGWNYRCYSAGTVILNNSAYTLQPLFSRFSFYFNINATKCFTDLPVGVVSCGDGWYSKITVGKVNAASICTDLGYVGTITEYGSNSGVQCQEVTNGHGGSLNNFGSSVSWRCTNGKE